MAEGILQKRKYEGDGNFKKFLPPEQNIELIISHIEPILIKNIIKEFNHNTVTGPCSIPANVLSLICDSISTPLSTIANICFKTGVHPNKPKVAKVIPIFKSGCKMTTSNYRSISLLSNLNKIFETLISKQVDSFLESNNIIYDLQFGFWRNHSTSHVLISITEQIKQSLDRRTHS